MDLADWISVIYIGSLAYSESVHFLEGDSFRSADLLLNNSEKDISLCLCLCLCVCLCVCHSVQVCNGYRKETVLKWYVMIIGERNGPGAHAGKIFKGLVDLGNWDMTDILWFL